MAPATIQSNSGLSGVSKYSLSAPALVLAVDNTVVEPSSSSSRGQMKTAEPPRIDPQAAAVTFFNGQDPAAFMAEVLKMMQGIQQAMQAISEALAANSKYQEESGNEYIKVIIASGNSIIQKIDAQIKAAEEAKNDSVFSSIFGAIAGFFCVLATAVTLGATAGLCALVFAVFMALPSSDNPLDMASNALSKAMGGGALGDLFGKLTMIAILVVGAMAGGATIGTFAEEGAGEAAEDGAEEAESSFTKKTVAAVTKSIAGEVGVQSTMMLNPLSDAAKAAGAKGGLATFLQVVATLLEVVIAAIAMKYSTSQMSGAIKGISSEMATTIGKWSARLSALTGVTSSGFNIAAGVATQNRAELELEQADSEKIYTTIQSLIKMLQSSIQQNGKSQQATNQSFQEVAGNFADLAAPFRYLADASEVLA